MHWRPTIATAPPASSSAATTKTSPSPAQAAAPRRFGLPRSRNGGMKWRRAMCIHRPSTAVRADDASRTVAPRQGACISKAWRANTSEKIMTPSRASRRMLELAPAEGVRVHEKGESVEVSIHRAGLHVTVTVPTAIQEWTVEATDRGTGASVEDWCDYAGDDATPAEQLDIAMADDVEKFVSTLLRSELRISKRGASGIVLEWKVGDVWEQAIPILAAR